ncbi:hypothetical protein RIF29_38701 [Crotalaria pallida]|uniref:Uncharacterized protein n=1 Tax=Crotalaria pallida TaxID=3830 RepID=A0AAN9HSN3_CROPI
MMHESVPGKHQWPRFALLLLASMTTPFTVSWYPKPSAVVRRVYNNFCYGSLIRTQIGSGMHEVRACWHRSGLHPWTATALVRNRNRERQSAVLLLCRMWAWPRFALLLLTSMTTPFTVTSYPKPSAVVRRVYNDFCYGSLIRTQIGSGMHEVRACWHRSGLHPWTATALVRNRNRERQSAVLLRCRVWAWCAHDMFASGS